MKKLLAVFDSRRFSESTLHYALKFGILHNMAVTGVFPGYSTYTHTGIYQEFNETTGQKNTVVQQVREDRRAGNEAVAKFETACIEARVRYFVHREELAGINSIIKESRYADVLIVDAGETFSRYSEGVPTHFVQEILAGAKCPVLVVPAHFMDIGHVYWLYDSSPAAVYAFKLFCYVFPLLSILPLTLLAVQSPKDEQVVPLNKMMKELISLHSLKAELVVLKGEANVEIPLFLQKQAPELIAVVGGYLRGGWSKFFHASLAELLIREQQWPLFIAHNR